MSHLEFNERLYPQQMGRWWIVEPLIQQTFIALY